MAATDDSFGYERAIKVRVMAQDTRHDIVSYIASHPDGLPSLVELHTSLSANKSTLYEHLEKLIDKQILVRYERDDEDYPQSAPRVFYGLTPTGYSIVKESTTFNDISALQDGYTMPSAIREYEPVPRPTHARTLSDLEDQL